MLVKTEQEIQTKCEEIWNTEGKGWDFNGYDELDITVYPDSVQLDAIG